MIPMKRLIVIVGATGSGKTDASIALAAHFNAPVISADSRQIYRGIPIGTAQPSAEQLAAAEHHFIASHDLTENFSCGQFEVQALALLERLFAEHDTVIAVGGSGLYIKALCDGMDDLPAVDETLRKTLNERIRTEGIAPLLAELKERDPAYYECVDRDNPSRVLRAVEVCIQTGQPYSSLRTGEKRRRDFEIVKIGIEMDRAVLYERIDRRVDAMIAEGLEDEARKVWHLKHLNSLQTVGYRELFDYFDGITDRQTAIELIKRNSRRYAKRQMTWFRRDAEIHWLRPEQIPDFFNIQNRRHIIEH